jgi:hypothetical protein
LIDAGRGAAATNYTNTISEYTRVGPMHSVRSWAFMHVIDLGELRNLNARLSGLQTIRGFQGLAPPIRFWSGAHVGCDDQSLR